MRFLFFPAICLIFLSCGEKKESSAEIYDFMDICTEDFYKSYTINLEDSLYQFEQDLVLDNKLTDTTFASYTALIKDLIVNDYFSEPLTINIEATNRLLYINPESISLCLQETFSIDSITIANTHYAQLQLQLAKYFENNENTSINEVLRRYLTKLTNDDFKSPFIKKDMLRLLYKWYYKSKYDREVLTED